VDLESGSAGGRADIIVRFGSTAAWVLEVGMGGSSDAKLAQAQVYGEAQPEQSVLCCAVVVKTKGSASTVGAVGAPPVQVTCTWSERSGAAGAWAWKKL
jgi:cell division inhibitor SulA